MRERVLQIHQALLGRGRPLIAESPTEAPLSPLTR